MNKIVFWGVTLSLFMAMVYIVSDTLAPFLVAFIFAYLLQPVIESNCQRFKWPRSVVTLSVFVMFLSSFIAIIVLLVPMIYQQIAVFVSKIPQYKENFEAGVVTLSDKLDAIDPELAAKVTDSAQSVINSAFAVFASFANYIWQYTLATINFFAIIALVPIILYYFLRDWPKIVANVESILPMRGKSKVREIVISINELLSAYIRGQLNICLMLTAYYVVGLHIIGLDLALLLGILSGFLIVIPFIGALISFLLVAISCYFTYGSGAELIYVTILFAFGHAVEGYVLAPKIIGDRIGLHPVWILFAVFAAGSVFGFVGVIFAIPLAGIVKVFLSHIIDYYKSSNMYKN
ncbi:MAG: AI-2E family transporter [Rickettsiaceae bacterium]|nr:AI-2E family transporter [Rickettsiaceae bacterium]MDP4832274.1 AI-2E family transporter [Rickettsiaceae bacterium]MDP5020370.1 AI-2E family transporter [Rickettsiaceae bacterium]